MLLFTPPQGDKAHEQILKNMRTLLLDSWEPLADFLEEQNRLLKTEEDNVPFEVYSSSLDAMMAIEDCIEAIEKLIDGRSLTLDFRHLKKPSRIRCLELLRNIYGSIFDLSHTSLLEAEDEADLAGYEELCSGCLQWKQELETLMACDSQTFDGVAKEKEVN